MSNRIFYMGGLALDITVGADGSARYGIDDLLVNAALKSARDRSVAFIGEASADLTGNLIAGILDGGGIGLEAVDRITEGQSAVVFHSPSAPAMSYSVSPAEGFNPVWPRINPGDIVVWGSYFSLDKRVHPMMTDILKYARARKAFTVYVPYFESYQVSRVTRVMPEIFDNLELADAVFATADTLAAIFGNGNIDEVYRNNLNFYTSLVYSVDEQASTVTCYEGRKSATVKKSGTTAAVLADVVALLADKYSTADK